MTNARALLPWLSQSDTASNGRTVVRASPAQGLMPVHAGKTVRQGPWVWVGGWLTLNSMPTARCAVGLAEQSGDLHAVGGFSPAAGASAVHERYEASTGRLLP